MRFKLKTMIASPCHHGKVNASLKQRRIADLDKSWQGKFKRELTVMMFGRFLPLTSPVDVYPNNCFPSHPSYCLFETRDTTAPFEFFTPSNLPKKDPKGASVWLLDYLFSFPEDSFWIHHHADRWCWRRGDAITKRASRHQSTSLQLNKQQNLVITFLYARRLYV